MGEHQIWNANDEVQTAHRIHAAQAFLNENIQQELKKARPNGQVLGTDYSCLASWKIRENKYLEAAQLYEKASKADSILGSYNAEDAAKCYSKIGEYAKAEPLFKQRLDDAEKMYIDNKSRAPGTQEFERAQKLQRDLKQIGFDKPNLVKEVAEVRKEYAECLLAQDKPKMTLTALTELKQARYEFKLGGVEVSQASIDVINQIAETERDLGLDKSAEMHRRKAFELAHKQKTIKK